MTVKRFREEVEELEDETVATANCLMLLSKVGEATAKASTAVKGGRGQCDRVFECKTCKKQFHSFQALGGHRASHKKLKLMVADFLLQTFPAKPKTHVCSVCGLEFSLGQALGGHMRRHRAAMDSEKLTLPALDKSDRKAVPILMRSNSSKRIFGFDGLDLNLTPDQNDTNGRNIPSLLNFFHVIA